ncbi:MAG: hydroxymethylbilane synthase [Candidatus Omnitrophota bacterium]
MRIRIGSRPSRLAHAQVKELMELFPGVSYEIIPIKTEGDRDKITPLIDREATDFFTGDIEKSLINGDVDAAIHSAKDLEDSIPLGLTIAAITRSISPYESLVSTGGLKLSELRPGAVIGTSSKNRRSAILRFRGDLVVKDIRGDIDERIAKLDKGMYDAIVVAHAALLRLRLYDRIAEVISTDVINPHPLQGKLAVQVRGDRKELIDLFRKGR